MDVHAVGAAPPAPACRAVVSAAAYWICAPLATPYGLSFSTLYEFDLVLVRLVADDGRVAFGESCPVPPYSPESAAQVWGRVGGALARMRGQDPRTALESLVESADGPEAFSYVAPATALEGLLEPIEQTEQLAVPVVGTVQAADERRLPAEVDRLVGLGHSTLKLKVGFDPTQDLRRVGLVRRSVPAGVQLRLDANEAWNLDQARRFLSGLDPEGVELLEQPLARDRWAGFASLADEHRHVSLMLDESIGSEASLRRAADAGARIVKLKLMKAGSRRVLLRRIRLAAELGLSVVVGNGVAGVADNWYESLCAHGSDRVGEMNGSLKLADPVFRERPVLRNGMLCFPPGFELRAGAEALERRSQRTVRAW